MSDATGNGYRIQLPACIHPMGCPGTAHCVGRCVHALDLPGDAAQIVIDIPPSAAPNPFPPQFTFYSPTPIGWECPKCHRVNAPQVLECPCTVTPRVEGMGS